MATTMLPPPPRKTANPAPPRPLDSARRTSSIDVLWPQGPEGDRLFIGRVRDFRTFADGSSKVIDEAEFRATLAQDKTITSIVATPAPAGIERLVGERGGNHLRLFISQVMPEVIDKGAPIYLALDDISGTALVSAIAWMQWDGDWSRHLREGLAENTARRREAKERDVCWGLKEGNSAVSAEGPAWDIADTVAGDLRNPADPLGWHEMSEDHGPGFRRARRIDVWHDPALGVLRIDAAFQDSAKHKDGRRIAVHEYDLAATADPETLEILTLDALPRILPFPECPGAAANTQRLIGSRIGDIRAEVLARLRGSDGCTHLNDALRALAEVPKLVGSLAPDT